MKKYRNRLLLVLLVLLLTIAVGFGAYTYAKYTATLTDKNGTVTVAKWDFANDNNATALVNLANTYTAATLTSGKIAPGTEGSFKVNLKNTNSQVGVTYKVKLGTLTSSPASSIPANLKFYSDDQYTSEIVPGTTEITGTLAPGASGTDVYVYWKWAYETTDGDSADSTAGTAAAELTIPVQITGTQVQPALAS